MSVLIRGMEMPKACVYRENGHFTTCPLYDIDGYCGALNTEACHNEGGKLHGCPLVPVFEARPKLRGRWNKRRFSELAFGYECSVCHTTWDVQTNYCPYCGADMRGGV